MREIINKPKDYYGYFIFAATLVFLLAYTSLHIDILDSEKPNFYTVVVFAYAFIILNIWAIWVIFLRVLNFNKNIDSIKTLLFFYFEMIFVFASIYVWLGLFQGAFFNNLHDAEPTTGSDLLDIWVYVVNAFHFSVVTSTTLGYGDVTPTHWISKLIVDANVLISLGIVALGVHGLSKSDK